jgi:hypothetical protein
MPRHDQLVGVVLRCTPMRGDCLFKLSAVALRHRSFFLIELAMMLLQFASVARLHLRRPVGRADAMLAGAFGFLLPEDFFLAMRRSSANSRRSLTCRFCSSATGVRRCLLALSLGYRCVVVIKAYCAGVPRWHCSLWVPS